MEALGQTSLFQNSNDNSFGTNFQTKVKWMEVRTKRNKDSDVLYMIDLRMHLCNKHVLQIQNSNTKYRVHLTN